MIKLLLFFLLFSFSALSCFAFQIDAGPSPQSEFEKPRPSPSPSLLTVELDRNVVKTYCPLGLTPAADSRSCGEKVARIKVFAKHDSAIDKRRSYYYQVSDGRVIGNGPEAIWEIDTSTVGTYTIQVATGINRILDGQTAQAELVIEQCPVCDLSCECPNISLIGPTGSVKRGSTIVVDVEITEPFDKGLKTWAISGGEIISGQHTQRIFVLVHATDRDYLNIDFELSGTDIHCDCPVFQSLSIPIIK